MESHIGLPKDRSQLFAQAVKAVESPRLGRSRLPRRPKGAPPEEGRSFPTWVVFDTQIYKEDPEFFCEDDPETPSARSRDSNGDKVLVSLRLVAPPAASRLCLHYPRRAKIIHGTALLAAHLDSILFRVVPPSTSLTPNTSWCCHTEYFVCKAGPSGMSIDGPLPPCYKDELQMAVQGYAERSHMLDERDIGLLRRGEDDFAVVDLKVLIPDDDDSEAKEAELFRYRSNALMRQWEVKRILISQGDGDKDHGLRWWTTDKVVSFEGNLCWIDYHRGILFCDVFDDEPQVQYVELPVEPPKGDPNHPEYSRAHPFVIRSLSVTESGTMVFVNVVRADGEIASKRKLGSGFTITSWSLGTLLSSKSIRWVKEGAMEAGEIWSQYPVFDPPIPCLSPEFPFVSLNENNIIYTFLWERQCAAGRTWVFVIDIKGKELKSVLPYNDVNCKDEKILRNGPLLPRLMKVEDATQLEQGTEIIKKTALKFHSQAPPDNVDRRVTVARQA